MNTVSFQKNYRPLQLGASVMLSLGLLGGIFYYVYAPPPQHLELKGPFASEGGYAYVVSLSDLATWPFTTIRSDGTGHNHRSKIKLFEDGYLLGPGHASFLSISDSGGGQFSHWGNQLVFSTSDNTNPSKNGRTYQIEFMVVPTTKLGLFSACILFVSLGTLGGCYFGRRRTILVLSNGAVVIGMLGLTLNVVGILFPPDLPRRYPDRINDTIRTYEETLAQIRKVREDFSSGKLREVDFVREMMIAVNYRMTNIQARYLEKDSALRVPITYNWVLWIAGFYPFFKDYDFENPYDTLERGLGMCKAQSKTLARLLKEDGFKTGIYKSRFHVVSWVETDQGQFFVDPDYGVMFAGTPEEVSRQKTKWVPAYQNMLQEFTSGEFKGAMKTVTQHFESGSRNFPQDIDSLNRSSTISTKIWIEWIASIIKWVIPIVLVLPLVTLVMANSRRQHQDRVR